MGRSQPTFSENELTEINEGLKNITNKRLYKHFMVLKLKAFNKMKSKDIAIVVDMHEATVNSIIRKYKSQGFAAVASNNYTAKNRRHIAKEEEERILQQIAQNAIDAKKIPIEEIMNVFESLLGHPIGRSTAYKILKRNEWEKIVFLGQQKKHKGVNAR